MKLRTHLTFNGQCEAAFALYATCLGARVSFLMLYGESGQGCPVEMVDKVFHATLQLEEFALTGVDVAEESYRRPQGFAVQLNLGDCVRAKAIYAALRDGGEVHFPLQETSWAELYAALTDRFGTPWEINCGPDA